MLIVAQVQESMADVELPLLRVAGDKYFLRWKERLEFEIRPRLAEVDLALNEIFKLPIRKTRLGARLLAGR